MENNKEEGLNVFSDQIVDQNIEVPNVEDSPVVPLFEEVDSINTTIPLFEESKEITPIYEETVEPIVETVPVIEETVVEPEVDIFPVVESTVEESPVLTESNVFSYGETVPVAPVEVVEAVEEEAPVYNEVTSVEPVVEVTPTPDFRFSELSSEDIKVEPDQIDQITDVLTEKEITEFSKNKPMEHPDAKITLNRREEIRSNEEAAEEIRVSLKENGTLKFVFVLGIILVLALIAIPYLSKLIMY